MRRKIILVLLTALIFGASQIGLTQSKYLYETGEIDSLYSNILEEQRVIWVQLPEKFNPESVQKYPVIYVLDGSIHLKAVSTVMNYYWGGFIPEMIIVGVSNANNRTRDLTTSEIKTRHGYKFTEENGQANNFTLFLEKELIPYVTSNYPVTNYRTLIGHSFGGLFTMNTLLNHTNLFDNYLVIDPSMDWDNQKLLKQSEELLKNKNFEGKSLFLSLGGQLHMQNNNITINNVMEDTSEYTLFTRSNIEFKSLVEKNIQNDLNFQWKFYESDLHGTVSLPSIMDGLIFLFDWYPIERTDKFNSPDTPTEELVQLIRNREKKLKDHFDYFVPPFDEELLSMLGYMNLEWGETEKSLSFFQLCAEYFPTSANTYDSLADFYESQEDYVNALKYVQKAFAISGDSQHKERIDKFENLVK